MSRSRLDIETPKQSRSHLNIETQKKKSWSRLDIETLRKKSRSCLGIEEQKKNSFGLLLSLRLPEIKSRSWTQRSSLAILCFKTTVILSWKYLLTSILLQRCEMSKHFPSSQVNWSSAHPLSSSTTVLVIPSLQTLFSASHLCFPTGRASTSNMVRVRSV